VTGNSLRQHIVRVKVNYDMKSNTM